MIISFEVMLVFTVETFFAVVFFSSFLHVKSELFTRSMNYLNRNFLIYNKMQFVECESSMRLLFQWAIIKCECLLSSYLLNTVHSFTNHFHFKLSLFFRFAQKLPLGFYTRLVSNVLFCLFTLVKSDRN